MNLQPILMENRQISKNTYLKTLICSDDRFIRLTVCFFISVSCTSSQMQTSNSEKRRLLYYTWLHCLNNSYINSELDLHQRERQCDTKCCFFSKIMLHPLHMYSVTSTQAGGKPWHMHGSSTLFFYLLKSHFSAAAVGVLTHIYIHTLAHTHTHTNKQPTSLLKYF